MNHVSPVDSEVLQVNKRNSAVTLKFDDKEFHWELGKSLLQMLEAEGIVKRVFPLHGMLSYIHQQIFCFYGVF